MPRRHCKVPWPFSDISSHVLRSHRRLSEWSMASSNGALCCYDSGIEWQCCWHGSSYNHISSGGLCKGAADHVAPGCTLSASAAMRYVPRPLSPSIACPRHPCPTSQEGLDLCTLCLPGVCSDPALHWHSACRVWLLSLHHGSTSSS